MSQAVVILDTALPSMAALQQVCTPERISAEVGPRGTRLMQRHFRANGPNAKGWPSTHFWARAADATSWQAGDGFTMITANQIGIRQRVHGGKISMLDKKLTIPAVPEAHGKTSRDFSNLTFSFAYDPATQKMRPALVEAKATQIKIGKAKKDGSRTIKPLSTSTGLVAIFWLASSVNQKADPSCVPSDEDWIATLDASVEALFRHPQLT